MRAQLAISFAAIALVWPALVEAQSESDELTPGAQRIYDARYLTVTDEVQSSDGTPYKVYGLYRGKDAEPIGEREFFEIVDRPEYAKEVNRRLLLRGTLAVGAGALLVGSAIELAIQLGRSSGTVPPCQNTDVAYPICVRNWEVNNNGPNYLVPGFMLAGSFVLWGGAFLIDQHPVDGPGLKRMADEYNAKLRGLLAHESESTSQRGTLRLEAAPYAGPNGGGLVLRGVF